MSFPESNRGMHTAGDAHLIRAMATAGSTAIFCARDIAALTYGDDDVTASSIRAAKRQIQRLQYSGWPILEVDEDRNILTPAERNQRRQKRLPTIWILDDQSPIVEYILDGNGLSERLCLAICSFLEYSVERPELLYPKLVRDTFQEILSYANASSVLAAKKEINKEKAKRGVLDGPSHTRQRSERPVLHVRSHVRPPPT